VIGLLAGTRSDALEFYLVISELGGRYEVHGEKDEKYPYLLLLVVVINVDRDRLLPLLFLPKRLLESDRRSTSYIPSSKGHLGGMWKRRRVLRRIGGVHVS
jgi:hypothetical protein